MSEHNPKRELPTLGEELQSALLYASNTLNAINWKQLRESLASAPPGLTEREHCELLLAAANGEPLTGQQWNQLVGVRVQFGIDGRHVALPEDARVGLVASLRLIVEGRPADRTALANDAASIAASNVIISPEFSPKHGRRDRVIATGMPGAIAFGLWLLLDPKRPFGRDLCRCQYSECLQFFFKRPAAGGVGAPGRRYCSASHAELGDREKARARMKQIRRGRR